MMFSRDEFPLKPLWSVFIPLSPMESISNVFKGNFESWRIETICDNAFIKLDPLKLSSCAVILSTNRPIPLRKKKKKKLCIGKKTHHWSSFQIRNPINCNQFQFGDFNKIKNTPKKWILLIFFGYLNERKSRDEFSFNASNNSLKCLSDKYDAKNCCENSSEKDNLFVWFVEIKFKTNFHFSFAKTSAGETSFFFDFMNKDAIKISEFKNTTNFFCFVWRHKKNWPNKSSNNAHICSLCCCIVGNNRCSTFSKWTTIWKKSFGCRW